MTSLCGRMAGFLKALGFESKPEYAEKIPEQLTSDDVSIHEVREGREEREVERERERERGREREEGSIMAERVSYGTGEDVRFRRGVHCRALKPTMVAAVD